MATNPTSAPAPDLRMQAFSFGLRVASMSHAYRLLEQGDPQAEAVFKSLRQEKEQAFVSNFWGVSAALIAGLRRERITVEVRV